MRSITLVTRFEASTESPYLQEHQISGTHRPVISDYGRNMAREVGKILRGEFGANYFDYYGYEPHKVAHASLTELTPWVNPNDNPRLRRIYASSSSNISLKDAQTGVRAAKFSRRKAIPETMYQKVERIETKIANIMMHFQVIEDCDTPLLVTGQVWAKLAIGLLQRRPMLEVLQLDLPLGSIVHATINPDTFRFRKGCARRLEIRTDHIPYR